jgi:hypothetical protein
MLASELLKKLNQLVEEYGDVRVTTFNLDRDICDIKEVEFSTYPDNNIYIG